ncbi:hypothetical protein AMTRI_Chr10g5600 [Amborella trichopoda]
MDFLEVLMPFAMLSGAYAADALASLLSNTLVMMPYLTAGSMVVFIYGFFC